MRNTKNANKQCKAKIYDLKKLEMYNAITKCLFNMLPLEFHGLNNYFICIHWSSKDEMAIVYSSFEILGIEWLLHMLHQSKFQGLNGYYICIFWSSKT